MRGVINRRDVLKGVGTGAAALTTASVAGVAHRGALPRDLAAVRSATAKYNDPRTAYADGYKARDHDGGILDLENVVEEGESVCEMGFHFANLGLLGEIDRLQPQVLVYGTSEGGQLVLGAVEYIVPTAAIADVEDWFHGDEDEWRPFDEIPLPFEASALHVWVHNHNPDGVFAHHNPRKMFSPEGCEGH